MMKRRGLVPISDEMAKHGMQQALKPSALEVCGDDCIESPSLYNRELSADQLLRSYLTYLDGLRLLNAVRNK